MGGYQGYTTNGQWGIHSALRTGPYSALKDAMQKKKIDAITKNWYDAFTVSSSSYEIPSSGEIFKYLKS